MYTIGLYSSICPREMWNDNTCEIPGLFINTANKRGTQDPYPYGLTSEQRPRLAHYSEHLIKVGNHALVGVAQWTEHWTVKQRVAGSIPSQGTCLGCGPGPQ